MGKAQRSWSTYKASLRIVRSDARLLVLPLVSIVSLLVTTAVFLLAVWKIHPFVGQNDESQLFLEPQQTQDSGRMSFTLASGAVAFFGLWVVTAVGMYFNAALIWAANERIEGRRTSVGKALRSVSRYAGPIGLWAFFSCTISFAIRQATSKVGILGRVVVSLVGVAWSLATFFVLPILIVEGVSVNEAFTKSKALIRKTWGEQLIGGFAGSVVFMPAFFLVAMCSGGLMFLNIWVGIVFFAVALLTLISIDQAVSVIYSLVLYRFTQTGMAPAGFDQSAIEGAFIKEKKKSRFR
jgi:Family of unknown function (DUF6159)